MEITIRKAEEKDLSSILGLVKELAHFEKAETEVTVKLSEYNRQFKAGIFDAFVAQAKDQIVGMVLFYDAFSTWKGKMMYLEDFVVSVKFRNLGIGKMLFDELIKESKRQNCKLIKWQVLDWNEDAIRFYIRENASLDKDWWNGKIIFEDDQ